VNTLAIKIDRLDLWLKYYSHIEIHTGPSATGPFTEFTTADTRIPLMPGVSSYLWEDPVQPAGTWYCWRGVHRATALQGPLSDAVLGWDPALSSHVLSVQQLKDHYLFGVDLTDANNTPYPDSLWQWSIRFAIDWLEGQLPGLRLAPKTIVDERHDYFRRDWQSYCRLSLFERPVQSVSALNVFYPATQTPSVTIPPEWIRLDGEGGTLHIVPAYGALAGFQIGAGGAILPLLQTQEFVPQAIGVDYVAGFAKGALPYDLRELLGKKAAFGALNLAGDLLVGAGIASVSTGTDGLSQSIGTTSSATNAGYGSRLIQYKSEIKEQLPVMRRRYLGVRATVA